MTEDAQKSIDTITGIAARVAEAMEAAAVEHGEAAIDLALLSYQVSAIKELFVGIILFLPVLLCVKAIKKFWAFSDRYEPKSMYDEKQQAMRVVFCAAYAVVFIFGLVAFFDILIDPVIWIAAFGKPELMIATKALQAAGLL